MDRCISVIVPVYNTKDYLEQCVQSILSQTYKHLEVLLVDDGSTDGSAELCDALSEQDALPLSTSQTAERAVRETPDWMPCVGSLSFLSIPMIIFTRRCARCLWV